MNNESYQEAQRTLNEVIAEVFFKPCCGYMDEAEIRFVDKPFIREIVNDSL